MKKTLLLSLILAGVFFWATRREGKPAAIYAPAAAPSAATIGERGQAGPVAASPRLPSAVADSLATRQAAPVRPSVEKFVEYKGMFADAPVVSSMVEYGPEPGQETTTRIVETKMKHPFVKIREIYEEREGTRVLVAQTAMVANQLMLQRPAGVNEQEFLSALRSAGAKELRPAGDAVVATFEARPHDPKALDDALAKVREALGAEVTIEYNYIRRLI